MGLGDSPAETVMMVGIITVNVMCMSSSLWAGLVMWCHSVVGGVDWCGHVVMCCGLCEVNGG